MNRTRVMIWILAVVFSATTLRADLTLQPYDADLQDLPHEYLYLWEVTPSLEQGEHLIGAQLLIDNLNDWTNEWGDRLYIRLLDDQDIDQAVANHVVSAWLPNLYRGWDNQEGSDSLAGYGTLLTTYNDRTYYPEDFTYTFTPAQVDLLANYITNDGSFGIGFDPDCHYWNSGITLSLETAPGTPTVPVPGALLLAGIGTTLVGWTRRTFRRPSK